MFLNVKRFGLVCPRVNFSVSTHLKAHKLGKAKRKYSETINLPKTKFQQWQSHAKRVELDKYIIENCGFMSLYRWQRENVKGEEFVLHDGPPYANGMPHMGHAINKILKDIINRSKLLAGHKVHFKPGWDCHGLPIELKALTASSLEQNLDPLDVRAKARNFAKQTIDDQKNVFRSWGVMADWDNDSYHTFDPNYVCNQLQQFYKLYEKGYVYREVKPVFWSPSTKTALAEAELEYNPNHKSRAITLRFKMKKLPETFTVTEGDVYALVWTTTPWTLPANQAIAFHPYFTYLLVQFSGEKDYYIVAQDQADKLKEKVNKNFSIISSFSGMNLQEASYTHPISGEELPLLPAKYVTSDIGTGLVHTAPAHGPDDFLLALVHKMSVLCLVDENGKYLPEAGPDLEGLFVLKEGNDTIVKMLKNDILNEESIIHSYPYDWRSKTPVILRASKQWFIDTEILKQRAIEVLQDVEIVPKNLDDSFQTRLEKRPYWCISRQRAWGVPIPALYSVGLPVVTKDFVDHLCELIKIHGSDCWWWMDLKSLIPNELKSELPMDQVTKSEDIIDIWLDSGLSWSAVLEGKQADLYVEGIDQFTGWFQSSLLTSVALKDRAPYKNIFVHGFALDEQGKKMSKSLGNVIDPQVLCFGGSDIKKEPPFGVDVVRWWVAAHATQNISIRVSKSALNDSAEAVKKLRNTLKFLLGSLHGCSTELVNAPPKMELIDQYMINSLKEFKSQIDEYYASYQFHKVCSRIVNFLANDLSSFYLHITKDRLYCEDLGSNSRQSVQHVMYHILNTLTMSFAPIMPILAEEVYMNHPHNQDYVPFFFQQIKDVNAYSFKIEPNVDKVMKEAFLVKKEFLNKCPVNLTENQIVCVIKACKDVWKHLKKLQNEEKSSNSELVSFLQASSVELYLDKEVENFTVEVVHTDLFYCERCRRYCSDTKDELCQRCDQIIDASSCT
ncbi:isoleucine--tRNA ligase, mitochondrial [Cimex lectularius]|uniref:isoleucine--tRNA ligase n=1 Tax=Cimex lectularius TaxID=79782 RepID=A0A8I6S6K7_CIMLE|nr:isoleucine--tRNA ligase, mitochondrial [Cimex lectularius]